MSFTSAFKPLTKKDVAESLDISIRTVENWVNNKILPAPKTLGNRVYWHPGAYYAWLDQRLLQEDAASQAVSAKAANPSAPHTKPGARNSSTPVKTELSKLHNRTQAQLESLMS